MSILIIGATGNIGRELSRALIRKGQRPVLAVRDPEKARPLCGGRADYIRFDFNDPETFAPALEGAKQCFFIAPHADPVPSVERFLQQALHLQQIIFSSGRTTGGLPGAPLNKVENLVKASGIPYTLLRPGWFMQNFTGWIGDDIRQERRIIVPAGGSRTAFVDVHDIGAVAAAILLSPSSHTSKTYELVGREAFSHYEVAAMISEAVGEKVEYRPIEPADYIKRMISKGWTKKAAEHTVYLYQLVQEGKEAEITPDIEKVLNHSPRRLSDFVEENKLKFS